VGLTQVLLTKFFGGKRPLRSMQPELEPMLAQCDAALIIGDPALLIKTKGFYSYDLAQLWFERTGKPFVFAVWAVRRQALEEMRPGLPVAEIFQRSRDRGLQTENVERIAAEWSPRLGLSPEEIRSYLTRNIYYDLDEPCLEGLRLFFDYAAECGAAPAAPALSFL
jgi:chorismate dehydratase